MELSFDDHGATRGPAACRLEKQDEVRVVFGRGERGQVGLADADGLKVRNRSVQ
jgi:hypothetical protein